jgi:hypothetical protein
MTYKFFCEQIKKGIKKRKTSCCAAEQMLLAVHDHPGIAAGKMTNRENVALQAVSLRIVNGLTKKKENARVGEDKMAPHAIVFLAFWLLSAQRSLCSRVLYVLGTLDFLENFLTYCKKRTGELKWCLDVSEVIADSGILMQVREDISIFQVDCEKKNAAYEVITRL